MNADREKQAVGEAGAEYVENGMTVGLGTGSTVAFLLTALAKRKLSIRCVATSPRTEDAARGLGIRMEPFGTIDQFDLTIDGTDQITPNGWLVKGGGAAHTHEKIVAAAASRFVVLGDSTKRVDALRPPIPLELLEFGLHATLRRLGTVELRDVPHSPDGGVIADYLEPFTDPAALSAYLAATPGVVDHGIFPPEMVTVALIADGTNVETVTISHGD